ncbi:MAG TPA: hypothetical protein VNP94_10655 [Actinomycetota bacterium]|nr:hypothetical protein [Actinomycetota bacterium]
MTIVRVPRSLWEALRRAHPGEDDDALARACVERGRRALGEGGLRAELARRAAAALLLRTELLDARGRAREAAARERASYERHLALEREVVPPVRARARELRAAIARAEADLRARGLDPDAVAPPMPVDPLSVDQEPPRYRTPEERRRRAVEFFRRVGGP